MPRQISESCTGCGDCLSECSMGAIQAAEPLYVIDQEECIDCWACVDLCPSGAITGTSCLAECRVS